MKIFGKKAKTGVSFKPDETKNLSFKFGPGNELICHMSVSNDCDDDTKHSGEPDILGIRDIFASVDKAWLIVNSISIEDTGKKIPSATMELINSELIDIADTSQAYDLLKTISEIYDKIASCADSRFKYASIIFESYTPTDGGLIDTKIGLFFECMLDTKFKFFEDVKGNECMFRIACAEVGADFNTIFKGKIRGIINDMTNDFNPSDYGYEYDAKERILFTYHW